MSRTQDKALRTTLNPLSHLLGLAAMALTQMDTVGAFAYLQVNLPALISRITDLAAHTYAKHTEHCEACRRQESLKPRYTTNSFVQPIQANQVVRIGERQNPSKFENNVAKAKDPMSPIQCSGHKRHTDEELPIRRNEPFTLVNKRHKVIIDYDGHTQKVLEEVARNIGICRSNIRRAKMSMLQTRFLPRTIHKTSCLVNHRFGESDQSQVVASNLVRRIQTRSGIRLTGSRKAQKTPVIDLADNQLELAHKLCETAAYQALRAGDCVSEIDSAVKNLKTLLETASNELRRLTEQKMHQTTEEDTFTSTATRFARVAAVATEEPSTVGTSIIEVDDDPYLSAGSVNRLDFRS